MSLCGARCCLIIALVVVVVAWILSIYSWPYTVRRGKSVPPVSYGQSTTAPVPVTIICSSTVCRCQFELDMGKPARPLSYYLWPIGYLCLTFLQVLFIILCTDCKDYKT